MDIHKCVIDSDSTPCRYGGYVDTKRHGYSMMKNKDGKFYWHYDCFIKHYTKLPKHSTSNTSND